MDYLKVREQCQQRVIDCYYPGRKWCPVGPKTLFLTRSVSDNQLFLKSRAFHTKTAAGILINEDVILNDKPFPADINSLRLQDPLLSDRCASASITRY